MLWNLVNMWWHFHFLLGWNFGILFCFVWGTQVAVAAHYLLNIVPTLLCIMRLATKAFNANHQSYRDGTKKGEGEATTTIERLLWVISSHSIIRTLLSFS